MRRTWLCLASLLWGRPYEMHAAAAVPFIPCQQEWSDQARRKLKAGLLRANRAGLDWTGATSRMQRGSNSGEQGAIGRWRKKLYKWANTTLAAAHGK